MSQRLASWRGAIARWYRRVVRRHPIGTSKLETPTPRLTATPRYSIERLAPDGAQYHAYQGNDHRRAIEAWESYHDASLPGQYTFVDHTHPVGHRGTFSVTR